MSCCERRVELAKWRDERDESCRLTAEDPLVDDGSDRKAVEAVGKGFPQLDVVSSFAWKKDGEEGRRGKRSARCSFSCSRSRLFRSLRLEPPQAYADPPTSIAIRRPS